MWFPQPQCTSHLPCSSTYFISTKELWHFHNSVKTFSWVSVFLLSVSRVVHTHNLKLTLFIGDVFFVIGTDMIQVTEMWNLVCRFIRKNELTGFLPWEACRGRIFLVKIFIIHSGHVYLAHSVHAKLQLVLIALCLLLLKVVCYSLMSICKAV